MVDICKALPVLAHKILLSRPFPAGKTTEGQSQKDINKRLVPTSKKKKLSIRS